jgi:hypothetical protein
MIEMIRHTGTNVDARAIHSGRSTISDMPSMLQRAVQGHRVYRIKKKKTHLAELKSTIFRKGERIVQDREFSAYI